MSEEKTTKKRRSRKAEIVEETAVEIPEVAEMTEPEISETASEQAEVVEDKIEEPVIISADLAQNEDITVETSVPVAVAESVEEKPIEEKPKRKRVEKNESADSGVVELKDLTFLYPSSVATKPIKTITGTFYKWRDDVVTGRICITEKPEFRGLTYKVLGWIDAK